MKFSISRQDCRPEKLANGPFHLIYNFITSGCDRNPAKIFSFFFMPKEFPCRIPDS
jgi:hypothetical protein